MFKAFLEAIKNPTENTLKAIQPSLRKALVESKIPAIEVERFLTEISESGDLKQSLSKLLPNTTIENHIIQGLEQDLISINSKFAISKYFKYDLPAELEKISENVTDIQNLINTNTEIKNKVQKFIDYVKKNKLKFSLLSLSVIGAADYLLDSAKNVSGCYKYEILPNNKNHVLCKVKTCESSPNDFSMNGNFCKDVECLKALDCTDCSNLNQTNQNNISYHCFNAHWYDIIGITLKHAKSDILKLFWYIIKYLLIFFVALGSYTISSGLSILPKTSIIISSVFLTWYAL